MAVIAKQLGHAHTRMTEKHYTHLAPSYVAGTIWANFPNLGIGETPQGGPIEGRREAGTRKAITVQERVTDAHWSLAMVLAWITYRTEQAVTDIKDGRWTPTEVAIRDLLSALRSGKLIAHGMFEGERIPHPIETAVWSTFEIIVKPMRFMGRSFRACRLLLRRGWALRKPDC